MFPKLGAGCSRSTRPSAGRAPRSPVQRSGKCDFSPASEESTVDRSGNADICCLTSVTTRRNGLHLVAYEQSQIAETACNSGLLLLVSIWSCKQEVRGSRPLSGLGESRLLLRCF